MEEEITILAHHLVGVIASSYFSEGWEPKLKVLGEQHSEEMRSHVEQLVNHFFDNVTQATITLVKPDSFCSPDLSTICKECLLHPGADLIPLPKMKMGEREIMQRHREYQLDRIKTDKGYQKLLQIREALVNVAFLIYYDLEPGTYSPSFLVERIDDVGKRIIKCSTDSEDYLPSEIGYSYHPDLDQEFPDIGRFMRSGLYGELTATVIFGDSPNEKISEEELDALKNKYPSLFATVGSDEFYYEVLNEL